MALTFDAVFYYTSRPDVLRAFLSSDMSVSGYEFALNHYNTFGWKEGYNPNQVFITDEYLADNPDVAAAGVNPFEHYNTYGQAEGRAPNSSFPSLAEFDWQAYVDANPDLQAAGINTAAAAYDHYITFGYNEERPGAPDSTEFQLKKALEAYSFAEQAKVDFLAEADKTEVDIAGELSAAQAALEGARATDSDRALAAKLADAQDAAAAARAALADADEELLDLVASYDQLSADLVAQKEVRDQLIEASEAALEDFIAAQGEAGVTVDVAGTEITADYGDGPVTIAEFEGFTDSSGNGRVVITADGLNVEGLQAIVDGINAHLAANDAAKKISAERAEVKVKIDAIDADGLFQAALDREQEVSNAQDAIDARNELISNVETAQVLADQLTTLDTAIADAKKAIEDLGYEVPQLVDGSVSGDATQNDIFVFTGADNGKADEISDFGAGDLLFIGNGYSASTLAADADLDDNTDFGSLTGLDVFIQQVAGNTVVYVELDTYDGHANGPWAGETITLVGVNADDVSFSNGYISVNGAVA